MITRLKIFLQWLLANGKSAAALIVGMVTSILGSLGKINFDQISSAILLILSLIAFGQIRSAHARKKLLEALRMIQSKGPIFSHETTERVVISLALRELWVIQETGSLLFEQNKDELERFLQNGGAIRAVFGAPTDHTARLFALRNASLSPEAIISRSLLAIEHIKGLAKRVGGASELISVRYSPYPFDWTSAIVDPTHPDHNRRKAVVRSAGFKIPFSSKLDLTLDATMAEYLFSNFFGQTKALFEYSAKIILITGLPRCGKTTLLQVLVNQFSSDPMLYYALSPQRTEHSQRVGFDVQTSVCPSRRRFATRENDTYSSENTVWNAVIGELREAQSSGKVMILDEIGPIQFSGDFEAAIFDIFDDPQSTLFASIADVTVGEPEFQLFRQKLVRHHRSTVIQLDPKEKKQNHGSTLARELDASLQLAKLWPRQLWGER